MSEFVFTEHMSASELLECKVKPGDVIYLSGFLDSPSNSRFDLSRAAWNGTRDNPIIIDGQDAVITACNRKVSGGWRLVKNPTPHYVIKKYVNLVWMLENDNFITRATDKPAERPDEWDAGQSLWFEDKAGTVYYKPANGIDANEQTVYWSSGQSAFRLDGKRNIHLRGITVCNCHTVGGNFAIANSTGITVSETESYFGSISIFSGKDISLSRIKAHDHPLPIMMQNPKGTFINVSLENMYVYNCDRDEKIGKGNGDYQAVSFRGNVKNLRLRNIHVDAPVRDGIALYQHRMNRWDGVEVSYCYVHDALDARRRIHSGGILIGGDRATGSMEPKDNIDIHHNVVRGGAGYGLRIKAFPPSTKSKAMRVWNNYSYDNGKPDEMYGVTAVPPDVDDYAASATRLISSIVAKTPS